MQHIWKMEEKERKIVMKYLDKATENNSRLDKMKQNTIFNEQNYLWLGENYELN